MNNTTQEYTLERSGARLHYWLTGVEAAPLVVFTHGATLDHHMFDTQVNPLCAAGYRVLTWDMRGHGLSKPMGKTFNVQIAAEDLLTILDRIGVKTAVLIGHSFGGFVSQEFIFRHPERVTALGVIGGTDMTAKPSRVMAVMSKLLPYLLPMYSLESFRKQTVAHVSISEAIRKYAYDAAGKFSKEEFINVIMAGVECLAQDAGYGTRYTIPKPFLLTHGDQDTANNGIFPRSAPVWMQKEPNCVYKVIPQAGHTANQDNPLAFNAILLDFLREYVPVI
jgi:pimeloyl-ACP methyl ester carboxylesterase